MADIDGPRDQPRTDEGDSHTATLRGRVVLITVAGLALTILVLSTLVAWLVFDRAQRMLDEDLLRQWDHIVSGLAVLPATSPLEAREAIVTSEPASSRLATLLVSTDGTIEANSQGPTTLTEAAAESPSTLAAWPVPTAPTTMNIDDTTVRYLAADVGSGQRIVVIGDLEDARDQALRITLLIGAAGVVCLGGGALVTSWAVNRALRPLTDLTDSATAIAGECSSRLPEITEPAEIAALSTSFNALLDQLDAEHHRRARFLATVSHEVRTPLTIARGHLDVLARYGPRDLDDVHTIAHVAADEIARAGTMVESLLTLARADEPGFVNPRRLPLSEFVADLSIRVAGLSANITLESPTPAIVEVDPERLAQALLNVITNAIRHNDSRVNVRVSWQVVGDLLAIRVDDDGRGFPAEVGTDLLAPFGSGPGGGSGLGLSVAHTIVSAHGGGVLLGASPGGGAQVLIELPVVRA